jgi:hypothetical protein
MPENLPIPAPFADFPQSGRPGVVRARSLEFVQGVHHVPGPSFLRRIVDGDLVPASRDTVEIRSHDALSTGRHAEGTGPCFSSFWTIVICPGALSQMSWPLRCLTNRA